MICKHISKRGNECKYTSIGNSNYCYLKSHHPSSSEYKKVIDLLKKEWFMETCPIDIFSKFNVPDDGWCFFTSFGYSLLHKFRNNTENETIKTFFNQNDFKEYISKKNWEDHTFIRLLSYKIYQASRTWLHENVNTLHTETKEPISDFIINTNDVDTLEEYFSEQSKDIKLEDDLPEDFWGGVCEQYALSRYFNVDVIMFVPSTYSFSKKDKQYKVMLSKKVIKGTTRYKISSCCYNESNHTKSMVSSFLGLLSSQEDNITEFFQLLPVEVKNKTQSDLNNTVFMLLFILDDDGDNISHYNYLLFKDDIYLHP